MNRGLVLLVLLVSALTFACGGKQEPPPNVPKAEASLDDALALLPGNAIAIGSVDARAFFGSETFGAELAKLVEAYLPIGEEAGFQASRDVDRVTFASYSYQGIDAAAVVVGRFDEAKIRAAAEQQAPTTGGGALTTSQYAGRDVYTIEGVGFTVLSPTMALAGSESGIRRVLERIQDGRVRRDLPGWMLETVESPGASVAIAGDFATQPMPAEALRQIPVPFLQSMKAVRVLVSFKEPGLELAGSLTYPDAEGAAAASEHVKQVANMSKWLTLVGIQIQSVDVKVESEDVQVTLAVDDQSLRQLLTSAPQWLGH